MILRSVLIVAFASVSLVAMAGPPTYSTNKGQIEANSHTGKCDGYDGTASTTGAGAGGFGYQQGQGNNQAGGRQGDPNYNPMICGNPNDNALTRGN